MKLFLPLSIFITLLISCSDNSSTFLHTSIPPADSGQKIFIPDDSVFFNAFKTKIPIGIFQDEKTLSSCQHECMNFFENNQDALFREIENEIFAYYKAAYPDYAEGWHSSTNMSDEEIQRYLPYPAIADTLLGRIKPVALLLHSGEHCKTNSFTIEFDCTWDKENGLGVEVEDGHVKKVSVLNQTYPD